MTTLSGVHLVSAARSMEKAWDIVWCLPNPNDPADLRAIGVALKEMYGRKFIKTEYGGIERAGLATTAERLKAYAQKRKDDNANRKPIQTTWQLQNYTPPRAEANGAGGS